MEKVIGKKVKEKKSNRETNNGLETWSNLLAEQSKKGF